MTYDELLYTGHYSLVISIIYFIAFQYFIFVQYS